ncbi:MAG TPA: transposase [bacterium]
MPRLPRVHLPGVLYYITAKGDPAQPLFRDEEDCAAYLELLGEYREQHGFKLYAYALFSDSVQLCLEVGRGATVSAIMHALTSRYTKHYNRRYGRRGHLFQQRFISTLIEKSPYLLPLTAYLHRQPVERGISNDPRGYLWTSFRAYAGGAPSRDLLSINGEGTEVINQLARTAPGATYEQYVRALSAEEWRRLDQEFGRRIVGSEAFVAQVRRQIERAGRQPAEAPQQVRAPRRRPALRAAMLTASAAAAVAAFAWAGVSNTRLESMRHAMALVAEHVQEAARSMGERAAANRMVRLAAVHVGGDGTVSPMDSQLDLNGTTWDLQLRAKEGTHETDVEFDQLRFKAGLVVSSLQLTQGAMPAPFLTQSLPDGTLVWESMQRTGSGGMLRWRGELRGDVMQGMVIHQRPGRTTESFEFIATRHPAPERGFHTTRET